MFELEVTSLERPLSLDRTVEFWLIVLFFSNDHQVGSQSGTYFFGKMDAVPADLQPPTVDLHHADVPPGPGRSGWGFRVPSRYVVGTGKPKWSQWTCGLHHR